MPDLGDQAAEIGIRVIDAAQCLDDRLVEAAEARALSHELDVRNARQQSVVAVAQRVEQSALIAGLLHCKHDLRALGPPPQELGDQPGRILEVAGQGDHDIAPRLQQRVVPGAHMPEVPGIENHLHVRICGRERPQDPRGAILRRVVDEDVLVPVLRQQGKDCLDGLIHLARVALLVEAGGDDGDEGRT